MKTLRVTFRAPRSARAVAVALSGLGTFDGVTLAPATGGGEAP